MAEAKESNCFTTYEYIAASNPLKAIAFLQKHGIRSRLNGNQAKQGLKNLAYKDLLFMLFNPKESVENKAAAYNLIKDIATGLYTVTGNDEKKTMDMYAALHPEKGALLINKMGAEGKCGSKLMNCCGAEGDAPAPSVPTASLNEIGSQAAEETKKLINLQISTTKILIGAVIVIGVIALAGKFD